jgi:hypothetical protein
MGALPYRQNWAQEARRRLLVQGCQGQHDTSRTRLGPKRVLRQPDQQRSGRDGEVRLAPNSGAKADVLGQLLRARS